MKFNSLLHPRNMSLNRLLNLLIAVKCNCVCFTENGKLPPYVRRLETLNLPSLVYRRKRGDMIMCFIMMSKQVNEDTNTYFTMNNFKTSGA